MTKCVAEELVVKVQDWGANEVGVSCILQMDVDADASEIMMKNRNHALKFMIVSPTVDKYTTQLGWLKLFGTYTKYHNANHGFFQIIKATYESGITMNFVLIEGNEQNDAYKFYEIEELEKSVKILICKN